QVRSALRTDRPPHALAAALRRRSAPFLGNSRCPTTMVRRKLPQVPTLLGGVWNLPAVASARFDGKRVQNSFMLGTVAGACDSWAQLGIRPATGSSYAPACGVESRVCGRPPYPRRPAELPLNVTGPRAC